MGEIISLLKSLGGAMRIYIGCIAEFCCDCLLKSNWSYAYNLLFSYSMMASSFLKLDDILFGYVD